MSGREDNSDDHDTIGGMGVKEGRQTAVGRKRSGDGRRRGLLVCLAVLWMGAREGPLSGRRRANARPTERNELCAYAGRTSVLPASLRQVRDDNRSNIWLCKDWCVVSAAVEASSFCALASLCLCVLPLTLFPFLLFVIFCCFLSSSA